MAEHDHLPLTRVQRPPSPRRKPRSGYRPGRSYGDFGHHSSELDDAAERSVQEFHQRQEEITDFDPKLILRFDLNRRVDDAEWRRSGLTVLDSGDQNAVIVFADDENLDLFRERLAKYAEGPGEPQPRADGEGETEPTASYEGFFDAIDSFRFTEPADRLTPRLSAAIAADGNLLRHFDVEFWFSSDQDIREEWIEEAAERAEALGGELLDEYVNRAAGIALGRFAGDSVVISGLAELDQVASVDLVPTPSLERTELFELQDVETLTDPEPPDPDAPVVGVIDSGVLSGHPLLEPAVVEASALHPEFAGQGEDASGHGTMVAGLTLYGNVLAAARVGEFEPEFWLASVRVLGPDAEVPASVNWVKAISEAIVHLAETWQVRVINISIGDSECPFDGGKSTPLAAELDTLARRYRLVLVICAGNLTHSEIDHEDWPGYLAGADSNLLDPGQASTPLTVGAISSADGLSERPVGTTLDAAAVAASAGPAPFTRRGPGVRGAIKPEFSANGGNCRYDHAMGQLHPDPAIEVVSTSARYPGRLFETGFGTSFAAPVVTNIAGRLVARYPSFSSNAIRALMLQGAAHSSDTKRILEESFQDAEEKLHSLCGYGALDWDRCGYSDDNRAVLLAEDELRPDDFHVYRIPMTSGFTEVSGAHHVNIGLAYTPPVRHRRFDYLAFQMEFQLVRAIELDDVFELGSAEFDVEDGESLSDPELAMRPTRTARSKGANQMARYSSSSRPQEKFHDDWYVVVKSLNKWMRRDADPQPYALAISLEAERSTELFAELEVELSAELEAEL